MMIRHSTIRVRLTLWYVFLLGLSLTGFSVMLYLFLESALNRQVDNGLRLAAAQVLGAVHLENGQLSVQNGESQNDLQTIGERAYLVRVVGPDGQIVASQGLFRLLPLPAEAAPAPGQREGQFTTLAGADAGVPVRLYTLPYVADGAAAGFVAVGQSQRGTQETLYQLLLILVGIVPATLALASLSGFWLARQALAPIDKITRRVQQISAVDRDQRLNLILPDDEVGRLARTFDMMLARLAAAFQQQRQFTADAAHEMRTPLAIMKGDIGVTLNRARAAPEYRRALVDIEKEVDRLTRLVGDLLLLARAEGEHALLAAEAVDVVDLLEVVTDQVRPWAEAQHLTFTLQRPAALPMIGDPDKLLRLLLNLLDNAIKYTPAGGEVTVQADRGAHGGILIEVRNSGPGIPADHLPRLFDRFYRADTARSRASGGVGLGLAIARGIVEAHGGHIEVRSAPGAGATFRVSLPPLPG